MPLLHKSSQLLPKPVSYKLNPRRSPIITNKARKLFFYVLALIVFGYIILEIVGARNGDANPNGNENSLKQNKVENFNTAKELNSKNLNGKVQNPDNKEDILINNNKLINNGILEDFKEVPKSNLKNIVDDGNTKNKDQKEIIKDKDSKFDPSFKFKLNDESVLDSNLSPKDDVQNIDLDAEGEPEIEVINRKSIKKKPIINLQDVE
ncbi:uncharacterized protein ASCRUDRAFT_70993 [Ascoidea rubescens DSM 1968]|uniref:Uncharacterized protein n=1 Tax=Ascoidea rubescens DSM 1968 TaxID=1344418 RepID=A0A1D2VFY4_9ASCO|nr:hypothetical protein ASCRUDRAFT_70993 [Ascoidea rubescens DSM 1968]ODV60492.1 hypothetical protein ASCRUDRAFT_70993 [Ascoidea rubescens DSM 1968]